MYTFLRECARVIAESFADTTPESSPTVRGAGVAHRISSIGNDAGRYADTVSVVSEALEISEAERLTLPITSSDLNPILDWLKKNQTFMAPGLYAQEVVPDTMSELFEEIRSVSAFTEAELQQLACGDLLNYFASNAL